MAKPETGKRQHIIPQQMIRQFTGEDGKLVELLKPEFRIGTRRRSPKGILFRDNFYKDRVSDFDAELLTPVEQKFASVYDAVLARDQLDGHQGAAFIDWVAAMLVRTQLVGDIMPMAPDDIPKTIADVFPDHLDELKRLVDNIGRSNMFHMYQDLFIREGWNWKWRRFPPEAGELIITDHPVCTTSAATGDGFMVIVPLSRNTVLYGGGDDAIGKMRGARPADLNFFLTAWAHHHIFAGTNNTLKNIQESLSENSEYPQEQVALARKPLYGLPDRIRERIRSGELPDDFDFKKAHDDFHAGYGPRQGQT